MSESTLTSILTQKGQEAVGKRKKSGEIKNIVDLFQQDAPQIKPVVHDEENKEKLDLLNPEADAEDENPVIDKQKTAEQNAERLRRTIFVGNVEISTTKTQLKQFFAKYGQIEKIWVRSLPVAHSKNLSVKARVILKRFQDDNKNKNCYVLFASEEEAQNALQANGEVLNGFHLRVDSAGEKQIDYEQTIFVGNLPYNIAEEEIREHFKSCGEIVNVRCLRDSKTHEGRGIGYVHFKTKEGFLKSLEMNKSSLKNRVIRVKKAVPPQRLAKKQLKRQSLEPKAKNKENAQRRLSQKKLQQKNKKTNVKPRFKKEDKNKKAGNAKPNESKVAPIINKKISKKKRTKKSLGKKVTAVVKDQNIFNK